MVVDVQESFMKVIEGAESVLRRIHFLVRVANLLGIPVLTTEQYPSRMGPTHPDLMSHLGVNPIPKMCFSCARSEDFLNALCALEKRQVILMGIETHICINQTAHDLSERGLEVLVTADAVGSRSPLSHAIGLRRMAEAGITLCHSESVVYEWMETAEDPAFREVLKLVKEG